MLLILTWKPPYFAVPESRQTHYVVRKYTTAGTGKGFVDEGVKKHYERL